MGMHHHGRMTLWQAAALGVSPAVLTSPVIDTNFMRSIALIAKAVAAGAPVADLKITYAVSWDGETFGDYDDNVIEASTLLGKPEDPEDIQEYEIVPAARFIKIRLANLTATATTVDAYLDFTEET